MIMNCANGQSARGLRDLGACYGSWHEALAADDPRLTGEYRLRGRPGEG